QVIDWNPLNPDVPVFNANLQTMANNRIANGDDIIVVNEHDALIYPDDLTDTLHPTQAGYDKMAGPWFDALADVVDKCP
ncbi:MAG: SGNH hydrolase, partial [Gammaproteobacteria bacterium]